MSKNSEKRLASWRAFNARRRADPEYRQKQLEMWRKYTDASMSTYAASPFSAAAQVRHDGNAATPPLQLCAAALRVRLAPLEKIEAAERRKASQ